MPKKKEGPKSIQAMPTGPMSRPNRNAPNIGMPRPDPRGDQIKPTPGDKVTKKVVMPKKFDGGYNKKTQKLVNITIDGKKATYEIPKGMTTKEATSLLKGTVKKKAGGTPSKYKGFSKLPEAVQKKMSPKLAAKYEAGGYLGYVKKSISGKSKIDDYIKKGQPLPGSPKDRATKKLEAMKKTPKKKLARSKRLKSGGSVGNSKVARQVKGFGAARKPKK